LFAAEETFYEGIERIMDHREIEVSVGGKKETRIEFLVNWAGKSDLHNTWNIAESLKSQKGLPPFRTS